MELFQVFWEQKVHAGLYDLYTKVKCGKKANSGTLPPVHHSQVC